MAFTALLDANVLSTRRLSATCCCSLRPQRCSAHAGQAPSLDRLRWQMLQIAVGAGSLILAFAKGGSTPEWWVFSVVGLMLITPPFVSVAF